ncbi:dienelactone hydrolase family protein [Chloroflexota bacterium]
MSSVPQLPGIHRGVLEPDERRFALSIPSGYSGEDSVPLILALHWGGPTWPFIGESLLIDLVEPALKELGAIITAPDRTTDDWTNPQSETEILRLIDFLKENYPIDKNRTLVTGYSMGGIGAWYLVAKYQNEFTGIVPISANPPLEVLETEWSTAVYAIHSKQDDLFPFENTETVINELKAVTSSVHLSIVENATHFETFKFIEPLREAVPWIRNLWKL